MKNIILSVLILAGAAAGAHGDHAATDKSAATTEKAAAPGKPAATGKTMIAGISGMHCKSCSDSLTKAIGAMPEVAACEVKLKDKKATIQLKEGKTLEKASLAKVVEEAGFNVSSLTEKK